MGCLAADWMCSQWKSTPLPPLSYTSSVISEATRDSLKKCMKEVEEQMDKLVTAEIVVAIKNAGSGRWPKRPDLIEENLEAKLDGY